MTEKVYDFATTLGIVSGLVRDAGLDYVDKNAFGTGSCKYVETQVGEETRPACIVGQFLARVGVSEADRANLDRYGALGSIRNIFPVLLTERTYEFLSEFQRAQDDGSAWGPGLLRALAWTTRTDYADTIPTTD